MERYLPDVITGEMIDVFDPTIPALDKLDPIKYYIDELDNQISECTERKKLWNDRSNMLKGHKEKLRELTMTLVEQNDGKIKTIENMAYIKENEDIVIRNDIKDFQLPTECFVYSLNISKLDHISITILKSFIKDNNIKCSIDDTYVIDMQKVPERFKQIIPKKTLTIRKSTTS
jgi:hypothetical protein